MSPSDAGQFTPHQTGETADTVFAGGGDLGTLCRAFDWSSTPLGSVQTWSHSLRTVAATVVNSRHPMFLWWGPELIRIYNDGYRPSLGEDGRHLKALGMGGREFWTEIWDIIGPQIKGVMMRGEATWHNGQLVAINRNERLEEVYWTYGYSPVRDDDGSIGGVLVVCQETTQRMTAERRLRTLHRLDGIESRRRERMAGARWCGAVAGATGQRGGPSAHFAGRHAERRRTRRRGERSASAH